MPTWLWIDLFMFHLCGCYDESRVIKDHESSTTRPLINRSDPLRSVRTCIGRCIHHRIDVTPNQIIERFYLQTVVILYDASGGPVVDDVVISMAVVTGSTRHSGG